MREHLYRGKLKDNGEWVYGDLITVDGDSFIFDDGEWNFVDAETVGEFTGLTDKNGTKIFEGDIVNCRVWRVRSGMRVTNFEHGKCRTIPMQVCWKEDISYNCPAGWHFEPTKRGYELIEEYEQPVGAERTTQTINYINIHKDDLLEVVGNIWDNSDL